MKDEELDGLRARLDAHHDWPSEYMFKFISPNELQRVEAILAVFPEGTPVERKLSGGGKYISLTIREVVTDADAVFSR
jgi:hypothetical protein